MLELTILLVTAVVLGAVLIVPIVRSNSVRRRQRGDSDGEGGSGGGGGARPKPGPPEPTGGADGPSWWPVFEREFAAYAAQHAETCDVEPITSGSSPRSRSRVPGAQCIVPVAR
jgi:hypothetical protein